MRRAVFLNDGAGLFEPVRLYLQSKGYQVDSWEFEDKRPLPVDEQTVVFCCAAEEVGNLPALGPEFRAKAVLAGEGAAVPPVPESGWHVLRTPIELQDIDALLGLAVTDRRAGQAPSTPLSAPLSTPPVRVAGRSITPPPSDVSQSSRWSGTLLAQLAGLQRDALAAGRSPVQVCELLTAYLHRRFSPALGMIAFVTADAPGILGSAASRRGTFEFAKVLLPEGADAPASETLVRHFHATAAAERCSGQGFCSLWSDGPIQGIIGIYDAPDAGGDEFDQILLFVGQIAAAGISRADALGRATDLIYRDELTGLYNRRFFMMILERELARAQRTGAPITVAILDTDNLKEINDRLGHPEGDRLLQALAASLGESVRQSDCAARIGGDEFGLVLADSDAPRGEQTIRRVLTSFRAKGRHAHLPYGFCYGIAQGAPGHSTVQAVIASADQALLRMKHKTKSGRHAAVAPPPAKQARP
jgi:diguanylate cyclase (GGDEF)-like protein